MGRISLFMTEEHTNEEIAIVAGLFVESADEMIRAGFFKTDYLNGTAQNASKFPDVFSVPPVPGAKLGRDQEGNPAWYIPDESRPGKFLQVELNS